MRFDPNAVLVSGVLVLLGVSATQAATIAHWDFENAVRDSDSAIIAASHGLTPEAATTGVFPEGPFVPNANQAYLPDRSGNDNRLFAFNAGTSGSFTTDVAFGTTPQNSVANAFAWDVSAPTVNGAPRDLYEVNTGNLRSAMNGAATFTVEVTFKQTDQGGFQALVGRDRAAGDSGSGPLSSFWLGVSPDGPEGAADDEPRIHFYTWNPEGGLTITDMGQTGNTYFGLGPAIQANEWYSVAAVGDGTDVKLYLKGPGDTEHALIGQLPQAGLGTMTGGWSIGRGQFDGNPGDGFRGLIDEIRISDSVVGASELLAQGAVSLEGDLDGDGFVGIADLNIVLGNWNQNVVPVGDPLQGDPTGDGFVGIADLNTVLGNWNAGTPPIPSAVPEPASLALLGLGALACSRHRR